MTLAAVAAPSTHVSAARRARGAVLVLAFTTAALAGCGGGVWIGGTWGDGSQAPDVSLTVSALAAAPGEVLRLAAAATDDVGVRDVTFYRLDGECGVPLGRDGDRPYEVTTTVPADGRGVLQLYAEATDVDGEVAQSAVVSVTVR